MHIEYASCNNVSMYLCLRDKDLRREYQLPVQVSRPLMNVRVKRSHHTIPFDIERLSELATFLYRAKFPVEFTSRRWFLPVQPGEPVRVKHPKGHSTAGVVVKLVYDSLGEFPGHPIIFVKTGVHQHTIYDYDLDEIERMDDYAVR